LHRWFIDGKIDGCTDGDIDGLFMCLEEGTLEGESVGTTDLGRAVVGLTVAKVGMFVSTGVPRVGIAGTVSDGAIGAINEGKFLHFSSS
jgi:hypothetical protein